MVSLHEMLTLLQDHANQFLLKRLECYHWDCSQILHTPRVERMRARVDLRVPCYCLALLEKLTVNRNNVVNANYYLVLHEYNNRLHNSLDHSCKEGISS